MATTERTVTGVSTIPAYSALGGTVTSNADTTVLSYTGEVELDKVYQSQVAAQSLYVYVPDGTPALSRVKRFVQTAYTESPLSYEYAIQLEDGITGASSSDINLVDVNLLGYSYANTGSANGTANGVTIPAGNSITEPQLATAGTRVKFQEPVLIDGTGTSFLILEDS